MRLVSNGILTCIFNSWWSWSRRYHACCVLPTAVKCASTCVHSDAPHGSIYSKRLLCCWLPGCLCVFRMRCCCCCTARLERIVNKLVALHPSHSHTVIAGGGLIHIPPLVNPCCFNSHSPAVISLFCNHVCAELYGKYMPQWQPLLQSLPLLLHWHAQLHNQASCCAVLLYVRLSMCWCVCGCFISSQDLQSVCNEHVSRQDINLNCRKPCILCCALQAS
jgi:hypothetical protein